MRAEDYIMLWPTILSDIHCKKYPGDVLLVTMNLVIFTVSLVRVFRRYCKLLFSLYTLQMIKYT